MDKKRVAIAGASGYAGYELVKLLSRHPHVEISYLAIGEEMKVNFSDIFPAFKGVCDLPCLPIDAQRMIDNSDLVFFALPHKVSMSVIPSFIDKVKIIDLSADYRLDDENSYAAAYGVAHADAEHLQKFVYGLPEAYRSHIQQASMVANPGCFPTGILLALQPVLRHKLINSRSIKIASMTGVSGGGRSPKMDFHFPECHENIVAYKVGKHQHEPEIEQELTKMAGEEVDVVFVPHLAPLNRGIYSTIYAELKHTITEVELLEHYQQFYRDEPFVRIMEAAKPPQIKHVVGTNFCDIGLTICDRTLILMSVIDNLVKGAAGQAVQNMNIMFGFDETSGLVL